MFATNSETDRVPKYAGDLLELASVTGWIDAELSSRADELVRIRQHLHANPELSGQERETTAFLTLELGGTELVLRPGRDGLGLMADLDIGDVTESTPRIAVRADIDALPIPDRSGRSYASRHENVAHACGHDAHASIVLGTARLFSLLSTQLSSLKPDLAVRLRFVFQPAEEISAGAAWMIEQGALDGVDAILGLHLEPKLCAGEIGVRYGVMTAYCDEVAISIRGQGGHTARPFLTTEPVAAAAQLLNMLYGLLPRTVDARDPAVFSVGSIHGGRAPNIIPDEVLLQGTLRTTDPHSRLVLRKRIRDYCDAVAASTGNVVAVEYSKPLIAVVNDERITAAVQSAASRVVGEDHVHVIPKPSLGGEDFALYVNEVPGSMFRLGCAGAEDWPQLHSPDFDIDESCLGIGASVLGYAILLLAKQLQPADPSGDTP